MRVDFFRVETSDGVNVAAILQKISKTKNDETRTIDIVDTPFRMPKLSHSGTFWDGDMIRIRMNDIPVVAGRKGNEEDVDLEDDEGIGEHTAFRYDSATKVLALQSTRSGVSARRWAAYLESFGQLGESGAITPVVVESPDGGADTISRLQAVRYIRIRYAGAIDPAVVVSPLKLQSTTSKISALSQTAPVVEVFASMSRRKGTLPLRWAKDALSAAYKAAKTLVTGEVDVEKIEVKGTLDSDDPLETDLLQFFMREQTEVPVDRRTRRMEYATRKSGVVEAWERRKSQLKKMFPART